MMEREKMSIGQANEYIARILPSILDGFHNIRIETDSVGGFILKHDVIFRGEIETAALYLDERQYLNLLRNCLAIKKRYCIRNIDMRNMKVNIDYSITNYRGR